MAEFKVEHKKQQSSEHGTVSQRKGATVLPDHRSQVSQAHALSDNRITQLAPDLRSIPINTGLPHQLKTGIESLSGISEDGQALQRADRGENEHFSFMTTANQPITQLAKYKKTKAKPKAKTKFKKAKVTGVTGGQDRYLGHDSMGNKRALIDVLNHRKTSLGKSLSHPEETAHTNSVGAGKPETGLTNITTTMIRGTAICHKISDKSIREKINSLFSAEKISNDTTNLHSYLISLVNYINPAHATDETPNGGNYAKEAKDKYDNAFAARINMILDTPGSASRLTNAHIVGKNVANSPVNLFLGDSVTNSSIQAHFDQNTYGAVVGSDPPPTPRSARAKPINDLVNTHFSALVLSSTKTKKSARPWEG
ncbi:hypothetical protein P4S55_24445 [Shewanella sp. PP-Sp27a-2]